MPTLTQIPASFQAQASQQIPEQDKIAKNYVGSQDSGGVLVEVVRFTIAKASEVYQNFYEVEPIYNDKPVIGEIILRVTNNTNEIVTIYPESGSIIINNEQVNLDDYRLVGNCGDSIKW